MTEGVVNAAYETMVSLSFTLAGRSWPMTTSWSSTFTTLRSYGTDRRDRSGPPRRAAPRWWA